MPDPSKCDVTHPQIASGTCAHCGLRVVPDLAASGSAAEFLEVRWNIARMLDDLDSDDEKARLTTIFNLSDHLPPFSEALPVIRKAFHDRAEKVRDRALTASVRLKNNAGDDAMVATCEALLRQDHADLAALHVLLHFYATERGRSESYHNARNALVLRLIEEMPEAPRSMAVPMMLNPQENGEVYELAKALWLKQVEKHPDNTRVLENASLFFHKPDPAVAGKLLRRCKELEAGNPRWSQALGTLYSFQGDPQKPESYKDWALMSLAELEAAYQSENEPEHRFLALWKLPDVALRAGEIEKSRRYADLLLAAASEPRHPVIQIMADREANKILGWHALYGNRFDEAKARLFSARAPTDSDLTSWYCFMDPITHLLGWMIFRDQRSVVVEYLRRDAELVPLYRARLAGWAAEIERGATPDFQNRELLGENLKMLK